MFSIERSFSRSNVAVPASADSSSSPTSPDMSDCVAAKEPSTIDASCASRWVRSSRSRARRSSISFAVSLAWAMGAKGSTSAHRPCLMASEAPVGPGDVAALALPSFHQRTRPATGTGALPRRRRCRGTRHRRAARACSMHATGDDGNASRGPQSQSEPGTVGARCRAPRGHPPRAPARTEPASGSAVDAGGSARDSGRP